MAHPGYAATANTLKDRIKALIPAHDEILTLKNPFDLFKVEGFDCKDLDPSLAQAAVALQVAQQEYIDELRSKS
jgi:hypothetical protein